MSLTVNPERLLKRTLRPLHPFVQESSALHETPVVECRQPEDPSMQERKQMTQPPMKAVLLHGYGDVSRLSYEDAPMPVPAAGEVLVRTIAVSINPIDWKLRRGDLKEMMRLEFPAILGRDLSGEAAALGEGVSSLKVGERVF